MENQMQNLCRTCLKWHACQLSICFKIKYLHNTQINCDNLHTVWNVMKCRFHWLLTFQALQCIGVTKLPASLYINIFYLEIFHIFWIANTRRIFIFHLHPYFLMFYPANCLMYQRTKLSSKNHHLHSSVKESAHLLTHSRPIHSKAGLDFLIHSVSIFNRMKRLHLHILSTCRAKVALHFKIVSNIGSVFRSLNKC